MGVIRDYGIEVVWCALRVWPHRLVAHSVVLDTERQRRDWKTDTVLSVTVWHAWATLFLVTQY